MKNFFSVTLVALVAVLSVSCSRTRKPQLTEQLSVVKPTQVQPKLRKKTEERSITKKKELSTLSAKEVFKPSIPGRRIARVSVPGKYVALTFDDGPSATYTPRVLDILRRYGVHATFFVLGENAVHNKSILARAAAEGHEIASHTWDHSNLTKLSHEQMASQMDRTAAVLQEAIGRRPALMRPPYGATNPEIVDYMMTQYGTPSILWDVDTVDWSHPGVGTVIDRAVSQARNGSIILLHDIHASTLQAVEGVVRGLQARGFKLVTVSQLIRMARRAANAAPLASAVANTLPPSDESDGTPQPTDQQPEKPVDPEQPTPPVSPTTPTPEPQQAVANVPESQTTEMTVIPEPSNGVQQSPAAESSTTAAEPDLSSSQQDQPDVQ